MRHSSDQIWEAHRRGYLEAVNDSTEFDHPAKESAIQSADLYLRDLTTPAEEPTLPILHERDESGNWICCCGDHLVTEEPSADYGMRLQTDVVVDAMNPPTPAEEPSADSFTFKTSDGDFIRSEPSVTPCDDEGRPMPEHEFEPSPTKEHRDKLKALLATKLRERKTQDAQIARALRVTYHPGHAEELIAALRTHEAAPQDVEALVLGPYISALRDTYHPGHAEELIAALRTHDTKIPELLCMICDRDYPVWYAPDDLWNPVMRLPDGSDRWPFVCPTCFTLEATKAGVDIVFKLSSRHEHEPDGHTLTNQFEIPARTLDARAAWWGAEAVGETPGRRDHALRITKGYREAAAQLRERKSPDGWIGNGVYLTEHESTVKFWVKDGMSIRPFVFIGPAEGGGS